MAVHSVSTESSQERKYLGEKISPIPPEQAAFSAMILNIERNQRSVNNLSPVYMQGGTKG